MPKLHEEGPGCRRRMQQSLRNAFTREKRSECKHINRPTKEVAMGADPEFDQLLAEAMEAPFSGWDFSWLEGRRVEEGETGWDYEERAPAFGSADRPLRP